MKDVLIVEDNEELAGLLMDFLTRDGFEVHHVSGGEEALHYLEQNSARLLLLDIMLPGMDGFAVCRAVRQRMSVPVLIMSARSSKSDKLAGYELGADDYIEKPVDPEILSAKIHALIQRAYGANHNDILSSGALSIHQDSRKVFLNGEILELNAKEYELLLLFASNPGKTLRKEYIFGQIWGMDSFSENQTLTVHVKMLRTKIEVNPREPKRITTVWGVGYRYEEI
ncbi:response regulator transcription factor [Blautia schinkii]|nr:response regulator transcription factor [Blautia schinkii]